MKETEKTDQNSEVERNILKLVSVVEPTHVVAESDGVQLVKVVFKAVLVKSDKNEPLPTEIKV